MFEIYKIRLENILTDILVECKDEADVGNKLSEVRSMIDNYEMMYELAHAGDMDK